MRVNPISDSLSFLAGNTGDYNPLGAAKYILVVLFLALLLASIAAAWANWSRDPSQRTARNVCIWLVRVAIGAMWYQGSIWKLPLPASGGLKYWTDQMVKYSAFPWHDWLVREVMVPNLWLLGPLVYLAELAFAVSLILGLFTRWVAILAALYTVNLWIGLYRHPTEWPWTYAFIILIHALLAADNAGYSLGLDAVIGRRAARARLPLR